MTSTGDNILLVTCQDQPGLIHKISGVLYGRGYNIISNREYVDKETGIFFMRTEFSSGPVDHKSLENEVGEVLPAGAAVRLAAGRKKKAVVMVSKEYHCLAELLIRARYGELNTEVCAVIANHEDLKDLATRFSVPFHFCPNAGRSQAEQESGVMDMIDRYDPDLIVLAKYMRILSAGFVARYPARMINIHHSFLPAFIGANPYRQAYERGVKIIGATAHYVTETLDDGPIICQRTIPVDHTYDPPAMRQAGRDIEKSVLVDALKLAADDKVLLNGRKTVVFD